MRILLFTNNATIEKLFSLSAEKKNYELIIGKDEIPLGDFDIAFLDKEVFNEELLNSLKDRVSRLVLILNKDDEKIPGFDEYLIKPFLPTDLIALLDKFENSKEDLKNVEDIDENELKIDLDNLDDLDMDFGSLEDDINSEENSLDDILVEDDLEIEEPLNDNNEDLEEEILDDIEEDILVDDNLDTKEEYLEENGNNSNEEILNDVEEDILIDEVDNSELTKENNEENDKENNFSEIEENKTEDIEDLDELDKIDEEELAKAIGEDIEEKNNLTKENKEVKEDMQTFEEKTLGDILKINWEELKKSKAKVTITIDFGG